MIVCRVFIYMYKNLVLIFHEFMMHFQFDLDFWSWCLHFGPYFDAYFAWGTCATSFECWNQSFCTCFSMYVMSLCMDPCPLTFSFDTLLVHSFDKRFRPSIPGCFCELLWTLIAWFMWLHLDSGLVPLHMCSPLFYDASIKPLCIYS